MLKKIPKTNKKKVEKAVAKPVIKEDIVITKGKKISEGVSLEKKKQGKFTKKIKSVKKGIEAGKITVAEEPTAKKKVSERGAVYVGHIPHGFFAEQIRAYFKQFGKVTNVVVCKSRRTGKSKGFGYVEFASMEVAKIAAETMNNYLMFKRKLIAQYIPPEKYSKSIFKTNISDATPPGKLKREQINRQKNRNLNEKDHRENCNKKLKKINKTLRDLKNLGIDYSFAPVNVPEAPVEAKQLRVSSRKVISPQPPVKSPVQKKNSKVAKNVDLKNINYSFAPVSVPESPVEKRQLRVSSKKVISPEPKSPVQKKSKVAKNVVILDEKPKKNTTLKRHGIVKKDKKKVAVKGHLMKLAAKQMLKSDHVIKTRSATAKKSLKNRK